MRMPSLVPEPGSLFDRIMTVVLGNMLWFVCAVPIVTLPAATAGLFAVLVPLVRDDDAEIFGTFFGTLRRQWLKSTMIFAANAMIGAALAFNFTVLNIMNPPGPIFWLFRSIYIFLAIMTLMTNLYLWPLLVLFDLQLRNLVTVSIKLVFMHPLWSLFTLGLALLPLSLAVFVPLALSIIVIFSMAVLIINWGAWQIIKKYVTQAEIAELNFS
jgi:uncharacterized membrane protein YesL